jgi:hypothetical protein
MPHEDLSAIEKHAAGRRTDDISGIEIQVAEGGGDSRLVKNCEGVADSRGETPKLLARERDRRSLGLAFHDFAHGLKKRFNEMCEPCGAKIPRAMIEKVEVSVERTELQFRKTRGCYLPRCECGAFAQKISRGL